MSETLPKEAQGRRRQLTAPGRHDRYQLRLGSALSPQRVSSIVRTADLGEMESLADLLDEVREKDGHLQSVLGKRTAMVSGAAWQLKASERTAKGRAKKILDLCNDVLLNLDGFSTLLEDLLDGTYYGRAVSEAVWMRDGRYQVQERFESIHARRFRYSPNDWKLRVWEQEQGSPFSEGYGLAVSEVNNLIPGKLVVHSPRVRGGYPTREGLGRTTVWYAGVFKGFGWRDFLAYLEQYGRPIRFGVFGTGKGDLPMASDEDIEELQDALDNLSTAITTTYPDTAKIELHPPATASAGSAHPELIRLCDAETSKAVLGGTLTTDAGTRGARSLGDTHREEELMLARRDARFLAETLRRYVLAPLVTINGLGSARDVPTIEFLIQSPEELAAIADRFTKLASGGLAIPARHARARSGIPEPEEGEPLMGGPAPAPKPAAPTTLPKE